MNIAYVCENNNNAAQYTLIKAHNRSRIEIK